MTIGQPHHDNRQTALIRLLADAAVLDGDLLAIKRFVLSGVASVLDADIWIWTHTRITPAGNHPNPQRPRPPRPRVSLPMLDGGWHNLEQKTHWIRATLDPDDLPPTAGPLLALALARGQATCTRQDLLNDAEFYRSKSWTDHLQHAGLDQILAAAVVLGDLSITSDLLLLRTAGKPAFTPAEREILEVFAGSIGTLHRAGLEPGPPAWADFETLATRPREVVALLLTGATERQIAALLGLSTHTVHDHVKALHTHFHVQSRGELLAQFRPAGAAGLTSRNGGA